MSNPALGALIGEPIAPRNSDTTNRLSDCLHECAYLDERALAELSLDQLITLGKRPSAGRLHSHETGLLQGPHASAPLLLCALVHQPLGPTACGCAAPTPPTGTGGGGERPGDVSPLGSWL